MGETKNKTEYENCGREGDEAGLRKKFKPDVAQKLPNRKKGNREENGHSASIREVKIANGRRPEKNQRGRDAEIEIELALVVTSVPNIR